MHHLYRFYSYNTYINLSYAALWCLLCFLQLLACPISGRFGPGMGVLAGGFLTAYRLFSRA